jgi:hypothetical protein
LPTEVLLSSIHQTIEHHGVRYAEIIRAGAEARSSVFFSPPESSFQFGMIAHDAGFYESAHFHKPVRREVLDCQQLLVVQRGVVLIEFYAEDGACVEEVTLRTGDAMVLIHGIHALKVVEDMQCISVKQGPFLGAENDKVPVEVGRRRDSGL